jgi:hypothetical protein
MNPRRMMTNDESIHACRPQRRRGAAAIINTPVRRRRSARTNVFVLRIGGRSQRPSCRDQRETRRHICRFAPPAAPRLPAGGANTAGYQARSDPRSPQCARDTSRCRGTSFARRPRSARG